jgi:beta-galactosidase
VGEHVLKTASNPLDLDVSFTKNSMSRDHDDAVIIFIELRDKDNNKVPDNDHNIKVEVSGAGKLLELESGNLHSHEPYYLNERRTHNGRLIAIVGYNESDQNNISVKVIDTENGIIKEKSIKVEPH